MGLLNQTQQKAGLLNRSSPSVPSPQIPQITANSTQQTSFQIPNEISVNFSVPKEVTKPSFPLQGTTISSAPTEEVSPVRQLISKISSPFVREIATGVVEAPHKILFGDPQVREQIKDLESKGYKVPFTEDFVASGFLPTLGKTQEEIIDDKAQRMVVKGIDPARAYEVATADTLKRKLPKMGELGDIEDMKKSDEYYNSLGVTDEEKSSLRTSNIVYSLMAGLDIAGNLPVGATVENVTKGLLRIAESKNANTIAGELIKLGVPKEKVGSLAEVLTKVDKPEVIHDLVQGAIGSQNKGGLLGRSVEKVTDPVQINEIKQTIKEGEDVLTTKTYQGAEITQDQADEIARSIDNAKARIGEEVSSTPKPVSTFDVLPSDVPISKEATEIGAKRISPDRITHQQLTPEEGLSSLKKSIEDDLNILETNPPVRASKSALDSFERIKSKIELNKATETEINWYNKVKDRIAPAQSLVNLQRIVGNKSALRSEVISKSKNLITDEAQLADYYKKLVKADISKGYRYPKEVLDFDTSFTKAIDSRARYEKGLNTSFSADDSRIVRDNVDIIGTGIKRQDGKVLTDKQKNEIVNGIVDFQNSTGLNLKKLAEEERWVYVHLNEKNPFLTQKAGGLYREAKGNKSISVGGTESFYKMVDGKKVKETVNTTMAHELGHALDFKIDNKLIDKTDIWKLKYNMNDFSEMSRGAKYWRSETEITARMIEEYVAVKMGHTGIFDQAGMWNEQIYKDIIEPAVEKALSTHYGKYMADGVKLERIADPKVTKTITEEHLNTIQPTTVEVVESSTKGVPEVQAKTIEEVYKPRTQEELAQSKTKLEKRLDAISELKKTEEKVKKTGRTPEQQERLEGLQAMKESIESTGFLDLRKYESKRGEFKGQLNINTGTGKFAKEYDTKLREVFNDNDNRYYAEELVDKYENLKISYDNIVDDIKQIERTTSLQKQGQKQFATTPIEVTSVESKAEEYLLRTPDRYWKDVLPFDDIVNRSVTDVKDKINILDYIRTPDRVLSKIGFDKEAKLVRQGYEAYLKELPKNIEKITEWSKRVPSKESNLKIFQYLDGKDVVLSSEETKVAGEIREWLQEWAKRLDLPDDKQITHYITHIFDKELIAKEFDEDLAKIIAERIPSQVYDPFLEKRLGKLGYKQNTWEALDAYVKRATRKANMDPALEAMQTKAGSSLEFSKLEKSQFEYIKNYIDRVNMRPTWLDEQVDNAIKSMFGYRFGTRPVTYLTRLLRQLTYRGMLGLNPTSALRNISQGVNTYAKLGEKYTTLGYLGLFKKGALQELKDTGVLADSFIQDRTLSSTKKVIEKVDKGLWAMFQTAETINRGSAYFGAKAKALSEGMSPTEAVEYAKKLVRDTQFSFGSIDTPVGLQSDLTKTLLQFQNYTVKQIEFLTEMAKNKEYAGLMRYALGGLAFVYTVGQAFNMKPEQLIPSFRFDTPPSLKFPVEVTKAIADTPDKYNQDRDVETKLRDIGNSLVGLIPAGTQIKKTIEGLIAIQRGASVDKGGNIQYEIPQTTEGKIQTLLFGKSSTEGAKKYFDRTEEAKKDMEAIQPIYDQIQELKNAGKNEEAIALYDSLGEKGKDVYKKIKSQKKSEQTKEGKLDLLPTFQKIRSLKEEGKVDEAIQMYDSLTDEQKKYYQLLKKQLEGKKVSEAETSGLSKMVLSALGIETASAMEKPEGQQLPEEDKIKTAIENVYDQAENIAPMIDKNYIKTLIAQESSNGTDDRNRKYDQGKYGWLVGFTKPTYQNIVEKAKTQKKYRNLLSSMSGFDTPENAVKSALVYSQFLLRDHTKEQETGKREWKNITATELYKLYNGGGSPKGVVSFDQKFNEMLSSLDQSQYE